MNRSEHPVFARLVSGHFIESLSVPFNPSEILVEPHDDVSFARALCDALESIESVKKGLTTGDHGMDVKLLPGLLKNADHVVLQNVVPERNESRCPVINDEDAVFGQQPLHQPVEPALVDTPFAEKIQSLRAESFVLGQRIVDGISIDALNVPPAPLEVLGQDAGYQRLAHASLSLKREVDAGRSRLLSRVAGNRRHGCCAFTHSR